MAQLTDTQIALLVADGFEQSEMVLPRAALEQHGARVTLISPATKTVRGWKDKNWADSFHVDLHLSQAHPEQYDALLLPGGVINPDILRITPGAIEFIKHFVLHKKPIAAICHGPWTLINAGAVNKRTMTSWPSIAIDLINAGALWKDEAVVVDGTIVTSRMPADIPQFNEAMIALFAQHSKHD